MEKCKYLCRCWHVLVGFDLISLWKKPTNLDMLVSWWQTIVELFLYSTEWKKSDSNCNINSYEFVAPHYLFRLCPKSVPLIIWQHYYRLYKYIYSFIFTLIFKAKCICTWFPVMVLTVLCMWSSTKIKYSTFTPVVRKAWSLILFMFSLIKIILVGCLVGLQMAAKPLGWWHNKVWNFVDLVYLWWKCAEVC